MAEDLEHRVKAFEDELTPLLKKYGLKIDVAMEFPDYRNLPVEVELSRIILSKHNMQYRIVYRDANGG